MVSARSVAHHHAMNALPVHWRQRLRRALLPALVSATTVVGLACWGVLGTEPGCLAAQGRWSGEGQCHTRLCLLQGDCGRLASPVVGCAAVHPGDSRATVYFHLGNPLPSPAAQPRWPLAKESNGMIQARFDGERLLSLDCPVAVAAPAAAP